MDFKAAFETFQPTVITLDLLIPDEDSIELLWYLYCQDFNGAIIVVSGASKTLRIAAETMFRGLRLCVVDSFGKPFNVQKLRDCLMALRGAPADPPLTSGVRPASV